MHQKLLPLKEIEQALSLSRWTLYRWLADGRLKGFKVGSQYRVPVSELQRLSERVGTAPESLAEAWMPTEPLTAIPVEQEADEQSE